jgi:hypothetical protein
MLRFKPIVLVGPPGSGKTTVIRRAAAELDLPHRQEVGGLCRAQWGGNWAVREEDFDRFVMFSELAADLLDGRIHRERPVLLEQWHVGNLAFMRAAAPAVYAEYLETLSHLAIADRASVIWLKDESLGVFKRQPHDVPAALIPTRIAEWSEALVSVANALRIEMHVIDTSNFEDGIADAVKYIKTISRG